MREYTNLQWGWKATCCEGGCEEVLVVWGPVKGPSDDPFTPALPIHGKDGWFWKAESSDCYQSMYRVYCPEHAKEVLAWQAEWKDWNKRRWEAGKETHQSLIEKIKEIGARAIGLQVRDRVSRWVGENPEPEPPWRASAPSSGS